MRKMIQIVIKHWKAELKEFARDAMNEIKDILFREEPKIDGRKAYVSDAFAWAKVFASLDEEENWMRDESKLEPLREDAMRIADGTGRHIMRNWPVRSSGQNYSTLLLPPSWKWVTIHINVI